MRVATLQDKKKDIRHMALKKVAGNKPSPPTKPQVRREEPVEESKGEGQSKADLFNQTRPQGAIDAGKYEAVIAELVLQDEDEKGQSVRINYEIATDGEFRGQRVAQFYKVFEASGGVGKGAAFLRKDLAVLGYDNVEFDDLEDVFEEIVEKNLGVVITVKINAPFTNVYLGGLCEDSDIIQEYLADRPAF